MPPLAVGDKVRIRPNGEQGWRKAEVMPSSYLLEDEQGRIYRKTDHRSSKQSAHAPTAA